MTIQELFVSIGEADALYLVWIALAFMIDRSFGWFLVFTALVFLIF